jgi:hypothetical protein
VPHWPVLRRNCSGYVPWSLGISQIDALLSEKPQIDGAMLLSGTKLVFRMHSCSILGPV